MLSYIIYNRLYSTQINIVTGSATLQASTQLPNQLSVMTVSRLKIIKFYGGLK